MVIVITRGIMVVSALTTIGNVGDDEPLFSLNNTIEEH